MEQQMIHGETWSRVQVKNNILAVWNATSAHDRFDWYGSANLFAHNVASLSNDMGRWISTKKVCGVIAALSPMVSWKRNMLLAQHVVLNPEDWPNLKCLKSNAKKAYDIINSNGSEDAILAILRGKKTSAFFLNILHPTEAISMTMDRHAISIALGRKIKKDEVKFFQLTASQYKFLVECYRWTAAKIGVNPLILQSATWVLWRREGRITELPYTLDF